MHFVPLYDFDMIPVKLDELKNVTKLFTFKR